MVIDDWAVAVKLSLRADSVTVVATPVTMQGKRRIQRV